MVSLKAKTRKRFGRQTKTLRKHGVLPGVLYGEGLKNLSLEVTEKEFEKVYKAARESSLVSLEVGDKKFEVLIHQTAKDPLTGNFLHVDFFHPSAKKKIEVEIPLVFMGTSRVVKELEGTLVREMQVVEVKGLAQDLPKEIIVDIGGLKTFEDRIRIKDLEIPRGLTISRNPEEVVALVVSPREIEEEEKPAEEKSTGEEKAEAEGRTKGGEEKKETK